MENKLERKYGLFTAICMVVGIVIGSGVFFKAQTILQKTEGNMPLGILAWIIGGAIMILAAAVKGVQLYKQYHRDFTPIPRMIVDEKDIVDIVNHTMGKPTSTGKFNEMAADMNEDGVVNIADVVLIVKVIVK